MSISNIVILIAGLYTVIGVILKPNFFWNGRRAVRMRKLIGETNTAALYVFLGLAIIALGVFYQF